MHHYQQNVFDFWVMPGGGVAGDEGILTAAEREVWEETGLSVNAEKIVYIEDFIDEGKYVCKLWVFCNLNQGKLSIEHKDAVGTFLKDVKFFSKDEIHNMNVFPSILGDIFWEDLVDGFSAIK